MRASQQRHVVLAGMWVFASAIASSACGGNGDSVSIRGIEPGPICPAGGTEFIINDESHITCKDSETISVVQVARGEDGNPCVQGALKVTISEPGKTPIESWVRNELSADALPNGAKYLWEEVSAAVGALAKSATFQGICEAYTTGMPWEDPDYDTFGDSALAIYQTCLLPYLALTEELTGGAYTAVKCMTAIPNAQLACHSKAADEVDPRTDTCSVDFLEKANDCIASWERDPECTSLSMTPNEEASYYRFMALVSIISDGCPDIYEIFY